ncbi:type II secretion system F family protein [Phenylobacterium sp.]|uniref:type II secretion system F family protein n=1 Tax=Phenylobacterium sp. TaxID=1871053 RepID=UPI00271BC300|nr:type II secretion system F family protein [Phenylobacterium sp.]MDO8379274.1 type II secretion system F family protein [Phenylobacterium sp.]
MSWLRSLPGPALMAGVVALGATAWWAKSLPMGLAVGLGVLILVVQLLRGRQATQLAAERAAVSRLLEQVSPMSRAGMPLLAAMAACSQGSSHPGPQALALALQGLSAGQPAETAARGVEAWPLSNLTYRLCLVHREQGGAPEGFLKAFRDALGMAEDLAKKRNLALIQIRWQANIMTAFFFLVLLASAARAGPLFASLLATDEGRLMVTLSAALVIWGRVSLNLISEAMQ